MCNRSFFRVLFSSYHETFQFSMRFFNCRNFISLWFNTDSTKKKKSLESPLSSSFNFCASFYEVIIGRFPASKFSFQINSNFRILIDIKHFDQSVLFENLPYFCFNIWHKGFFCLLCMRNAHIKDSKQNTLNLTQNF